jgi:hypothetical protein
LPTNDGFEDREGHQAPFTLPRKEENAQHRSALKTSTSVNTGNPELGTEADSPLLDRFDFPNDLVELRPIAGIELGMEQLTINVDLESATA